MKWGAFELLLWLPLAVPLAWLLLGLTARRRRALARLVDPAMLPVLAPHWAPARARQRLWLRLLALVLLWLALARPQWGYHWEEVTRRGLDIMVVFDTSRSMTATDIKPTRLQQAQWGLRGLVRELRGDRIGLVPFAGSSVLMCPLTTEYGAFLMTVDDLYAGIIPRGGTAIEQALRTAMEALPEDGNADRVILLITDGEDHEGDPLALIPELQRRKIRVYTIGIGTLEGGLIPGDDGGYFRDRQGQIVQTALREDALQRLALATGGTYVRSAPGDIGLDRVFQESIDRLVRDEQDTRSIRVYEERFAWFILAALALLTWEALLSDRRKIPQEVAA